MNILHAHDSICSYDLMSGSMFLAGPTPRERHIPHWRDDAVEYLKGLGYEGAVFIPTGDIGLMTGGQDQQIEWEWKAMDSADVIVFWVCRDLNVLPGFTTNIEWGEWYKSGKVVFGSPPGTPRVGYMKKCAKHYNVSTSENLERTLVEGMTLMERLRPILS